MDGLPAAVRQVLDDLLEGRSRRDLGQRHGGISGRYRERGNSAGVVRDAADALAYAVARMPATHAAMAHALRQGDPSGSFAPVTLLDIGAGPGSAAIAALTAFPGLRRLTLVERNRPFLTLAGQLLKPLAEGRTLDVIEADIGQPPALPHADLVTAGYVLTELGEAQARRLALVLWELAGGALVITEPGTPEAFRRLRTIRDDLIAAGAQVAAPCTHHARCPMAETDWCRVPIRVPRSRDHRLLKGGQLGHEDEPVAYLALRRVPAVRVAESRVVGPPRVSKGDISMPVCDENGVRVLTARRRDREMFKALSRAAWGDPIGHAVPNDTEA
jgi:ribosomal protein RSM22 (predicted rRNA methylase)